MNKMHRLKLLLKIALVRVSSIQIIQLESKTTAKVFGKVDTTETYQIAPCSILLVLAIL